MPLPLQVLLEIWDHWIWLGCVEGLRRRFACVTTYVRSAHVRVDNGPVVVKVPLTSSCRNEHAEKPFPLKLLDLSHDPYADSQQYRSELASHNCGDTSTAIGDSERASMC